MFPGVPFQWIDAGAEILVHLMYTLEEAMSRKISVVFLGFFSFLISVRGREPQD